jgi:hypothetical protein
MHLQEPHDSHYNPQALYIRDPLINISVFGVKYALE